MNRGTLREEEIITCRNECKHLLLNNNFVLIIAAHYFAGHVRRNTYESSRGKR